MAGGRGTLHGMRNLRLLIIGSLLLSALYAPVLSEAAGVPVVSRVSAGTMCSDGWVSPSDGGSGTCSWHGGISGGGSNSFGAPSQGKFGQPPSNSWNSNPWGNSWSITPIATPRPLIFNPTPTIRPFRTLSPIPLAPIILAPPIKLAPAPTLSPGSSILGIVMCKKDKKTKFFTGAKCPAGWKK